MIVQTEPRQAGIDADGLTFADDDPTLSVAEAARLLERDRTRVYAVFGVQDAHNLAWKLASVVSGTGDSRLLDTYESERQPVARWVAAWSLESFRAI